MTIIILIIILFAVLYEAKIITIDTGRAKYLRSKIKSWFAKK